MELNDAFRIIAFGTRALHPHMKKDVAKCQKTSQSTIDISNDDKENHRNDDRPQTSSETSSISAPTIPLKLTTSIVSTQALDKESSCKPTRKKKVKVDDHIQADQEMRRKHKIYVWGTDIPKPKESFDELMQKFPVSGRSLFAKNFNQEFGFESPTPIQMQVIPTMFRRREILACAPTGSGKTIAYLLPLFRHLCKISNKTSNSTSARYVKTVVLEPTRELAHQTYTVAKRLCHATGIRIHFTKCVKSTKKRSVVLDHDMIISTPKRFINLMKKKMLVLNRVEWLVVDESDKLFESGPGNMRDQLAEIYKACDNVKLRRAFFSATFSFEVEEWCKLNLDNVITIGVGKRNSALETIEQELQFVGDEYGKLLALKDALRAGLVAPILIFVQAKRRAEQLYNELSTEAPYGKRVDLIHSDRTQEQRIETIRRFRVGETFILICTEILGRGIDFKGVNVVINYDFPLSPISYIHRIGRTGRAGRPGKAITYFVEADKVLLRSIANVMKTAGCDVPDYMLKIPKPNKDVKRKLQKKGIKRKSINNFVYVKPDEKRRGKFSKKFVTKEQCVAKQETSANNSIKVVNPKKRKLKSGVKPVNVPG